MFPSLLKTLNSSAMIRREIVDKVGSTRASEGLLALMARYSARDHRRKARVSLAEGSCSRKSIGPKARNKRHVPCVDDIIGVSSKLTCQTQRRQHSPRAINNNPINLYFSTSLKALILIRWNTRRYTHRLLGFMKPASESICLHTIDSSIFRLSPKCVLKCRWIVLQLQYCYQ